MITKGKYERVNHFHIDISDFGDGWEEISLILNNHTIFFRASGIGEEPLSTLIEAVDILDKVDISEKRLNTWIINWLSEPGTLGMSLTYNPMTGKLSLNIKLDKYENSNKDSVRRWIFIMDYFLFRNAVIDIVMRTLNKFGIRGFNKNWNDGSETLHIGTLLSILGSRTELNKDLASYRSDFKKEISLLSSLVFPS